MPFFFRVYACRMFQQTQAEKPQAQADARALAAGLRAPVCMAALQKGWIECLC